MSHCRSGGFSNHFVPEAAIIHQQGEKRRIPIVWSTEPELTDSLIMKQLERLIQYDRSSQDQGHGGKICHHDEDVAVGEKCLLGKGSGVVFRVVLVEV